MVSQQRPSDEEPAWTVASPGSVVERSESPRRPGGTLYRSIMAEVLIPTVFTLAILTVMLLTQDLLGFSDLVINRGLGLGTVLWIAFYQTVPLVAQTLPFAVLVGSLIGLGRLGADRELLVLEASGVPASRLIGPIMAFAAVVTALGMVLSLSGSPWSNRNLDEALDRISRENPAVTMSAGVVQKFGKWKIEAREVSPQGDQMRGVLLWMSDVGETVFAERGELQPDPRGARVVLHNGTMVFDPREQLRVLHFEQMVTYLERKLKIIERTETDKLKGLSLAELGSLVAGASDEATERKSRVEMHRRFAMPSATLIFGLLAVPLFFVRAHFSRAGGAMLGILATLSYYGLVQLGDGMIQAGTLSIATGVWLPNVVGVVAALAMVFRLTRISAFGRHSDRPSSRATKVKQPKVKKPSHRSAAAPALLQPKRWALQRYVAGSFVRMLGVLFVALLVAYFLVDLLERLEWFAKYEPSVSQFAQFYGWRLPLLASRVLPMAMLLATGLTVSLLAAQGELMGMRACGIPAPRSMAPILIICALVTPLYFLLNDEVLPRTNTQYHEVQREIRGESRNFRSASLWYRVGNSVYEAEDLNSREGTATRIKIYQLGENARPLSRVDAAEARHIGRGVWRLSDAIRVDLSDGGVRSVDAEPFAKLGEGLEVLVDTRHLSVAELRREIEEVEAGGMDATPFRVDYYVKWAAPLSCLVLPALALFFAIGGPPFPSASHTGILSVVAAVTFILATGVSASLGHGSAIPPVVAGWAPLAIFGAVAAYLGFRLRNLRRR